MTNSKDIIEAALFAVEKPLSIKELSGLFLDGESVSVSQIQANLTQIEQEYVNKPVELMQVADGYRFQIRVKYSPWIRRLWQEKPVKYSKALLETLAVIVYQQPVTRAEIEKVRGVAVSASIIRTLEERSWIVACGYKEVPGRPMQYKTTKAFLNDLNLRDLAELPPLASLDEWLSI